MEFCCKLLFWFPFFWLLVVFFFLVVVLRVGDEEKNDGFLFPNLNVFMRTKTNLSIFPVQYPLGSRLRCLR